MARNDLFLRINNKVCTIPLKIMMKNTLLLLLFLVSCGSIAQTKGEVVLDWVVKKEMFYGDFKRVIPSFSNLGFDYNDTNKSIGYTHRVVQPIVFDEGVLQITAVNYQMMGLMS